jgi:hypothetical protein
MDLWKNVNPGCMRGYHRMPHSAAHEQFEYDQTMIPLVDKRQHLKKNDFSEHTEQGAGIMKALISNK